MNNEETLKEQMLLYICKRHEDYGNGIIVVAAKNAFNAMKIIRSYTTEKFLDKDLEQIVGATYVGTEHVITEQSYME
jgi:hypothetical protein